MKKIMNQLWLLLAMTLSLLASGCVPLGGSTLSLLSGSSGSSLIGTMATGAPIADAAFTITNTSNTQVASGTTSATGTYGVTIDSTGGPYLIQVTVPTTGTVYSAIVTADDINNNLPVNVTPITNVVAMMVMNSNSGSFTGMSATEVSSARSQAATAVSTALAPVMSQFGVTATGEGLLTTSFVANGVSPMDAMLDTLNVSCSQSNGSCSIQPKSTQAQQTIASSSTTLSLNPATAATQASTVAQTLQTVATQIKSSAPPVVVFSQIGAWGSEGDSWAGYTGNMTLYNLTDQAFSNWTVTFTSKYLQASGFWNANGMQSGTTFAVSAPTWSGGIAPGGSFSAGFNGTGILADATDLGNCVITTSNNDGSTTTQSCLIEFDSSVNAQVANSPSWSTYSQFLVNKGTVSVAPTVPTMPTQPPQTGTAVGNIVAPTEISGSSSTNLVTFSAMSSWDGGYNGNIRLQNLSGTDTTSWSLTFNLPSGDTNHVFGSWGNYVVSQSGATVTLTNASWNGAIPNGSFLDLGFGGSGTLTQDVTNCTVQFNGGMAQACSLAYGTLTAANNLTQTTASLIPTNSNSSTSINTGSTVSGSSSGPSTGSLNTSLNNNSSSSSNSNSSSSSNSSMTQADQTKRVFVGYYPSWSDNWFSATDWAGNALTDSAIYAASHFASVPATYTHVVAAFAQPNFSWGGLNANAWTGTGLNFNGGPKDIKQAIHVLRIDRNIHVLLAVGGATYGNWTQLSSEAGQTGSNAPTKAALTQFLIDMDMDGLDVDYEIGDASSNSVTAYAKAIQAMYEAVQAAGQTSDGKTRLLTVAGWSTGADCISSTTADSACTGLSSYWGGLAGRERLVFSSAFEKRTTDSSRTIASLVDMVNIMSYDAQTLHYDPIMAYSQYRSLMPSNTIVSVGLEIPMEGWAGGMLTIASSTTCSSSGGSAGLYSFITTDQYGNTRDPLGMSYPQAYSVQRFATSVSLLAGGDHPRDGVMLWQMLSPGYSSTYPCVTATPALVQQKVSTLFSLPTN